MTQRFLPQSAEVREALLELEERRDAGGTVDVIVRVICHSQTIGRVWDLSPGRAVFVAGYKQQPTVVGGGQPARRADRRIPTVEVCLPEVAPPSRSSATTPEEVAAQHLARVEETRLMPSQCIEGHKVLLPRVHLRGAVRLYRARKSKRPVIIFLKLENTGPDSSPVAVLDSMK
jgi:hypothetical protein